MKIGYPCINRTIGCTANSTFRLKNYSEENLIEKVTNNINCLKQILEFNLKHNLLFFRISSDLVPFASHPICKYNWQNHFKEELRLIGDFIKKHNFRISMHPDQFTILNSENRSIVEKSIKELDYHCDILDLMELDKTAKVQIHIGGVYGNKEEAIKRFIESYNQLSEKIKQRLVIENDDKSYSLKDCISVNAHTRIPVVFDSFHHECLNNNEPVREALLMAKNTWNKKDGELMVDYSTQKQGERKGAHTEHINLAHFKDFLKKAKNINFDIMLEIKDKEKSALKAIKELK